MNYYVATSIPYVNGEPHIGHALEFLLADVLARHARKEGKPPSRYMTTRNKKLQTEKVELKKFNPFLRRHTVHREIK